MTRLARAFEDGAYYHLYNRGNNKEAIFHQAADNERFLWLMAEAAGEYDVGIHAYCLMPNHYHALVRQRPGGSMVQMMLSFATAYAMYYNRAYGHVGHVFQGRYQTRLIRNEQDLVEITRYIHLNPANIADYRSYEWSSYRSYATGQPNIYCSTRPVLQTFRASQLGSYAAFCKPVKGPGLKLLDDEVVEAQH
jgi:putative transposase